MGQRCSGGSATRSSSLAEKGFIQDQVANQLLVLPVPVPFATGGGG